MRFKIKIWHLIITLCIAIILIRFNLLIDTFLLFIQIIKLLFTYPSILLEQLSFSMFDSLFSSFLIVAIPIYLFLKRNRIKVFSKKINFTSLIVIILMFFFCMAPLIANSNPNFQKSLSATKLLPPFSRVKVLHYDRHETRDPVCTYIS